MSKSFSSTSKYEDFSDKKKEKERKSIQMDSLNLQEFNKAKAFDLDLFVFTLNIKSYGYAQDDDEFFYINSKGNI